MDYLTKGNWETGPDVYLFNLPIAKTCRPTAWCKENCYGKKGNYKRFERSIGRALDKRYELSLSDEFAETITKEIFRRKISLVRVHVTGDFYSKKYVEGGFRSRKIALKRFSGQRPKEEIWRMLFWSFIRCRILILGKASTPRGPSWRWGFRSRR